MSQPLNHVERNRKLNIAIIGTGASSLYLLKNLLERVDSLAGTIAGLVLFERGERAGMGMPYNPATTDRYNLCNISSEELPRLQQTLAEWLRGQNDSCLTRFGLKRDEISASETYPRLALGEYFESQFDAVVQRLRRNGIDVQVRTNAEVIDLCDDAEHCEVVVVGREREERFDRVVIATGHAFKDADVPEHGYFASPWPIQKLFPVHRPTADLTIGTLGASLSAFDVVSSLAHRNGRFEKDGQRLRFVPHPKAGAFRIVMHTSKGWLPHLQYEQCRPFREVYRFVGRSSLLAMRDPAGFLRLQDYFDLVCRPALSDAFVRDHRPDLAMKLLDRSYSLETFVHELSAEHEYLDAFEGMKKEYTQASRSIREDRPIHWKETLDDLMYTLSYHADLMPAEDHERFHTTILSFLMNVIAAMPLTSAQILLALHEAGRLTLQAGHASVKSSQDGETVVEVEGDAGNRTTCRYGLFVDCAGQSATPLDQFPFATLVKQGAVRAARVRFADASARAATQSASPQRMMDTDQGPAFRLDGIDVDAAYRIIGNEGTANPRIFDVAFPHTAGLRPYSYGLQACNHTAGVVIEAWRVEAESGSAPSSSTVTLTRLHNNVANED